MENQLVENLNSAEQDKCAVDHVKVLRDWHVRIVDLLIANPGISQGTIAAQVQKTQPWVSRVMNSDMFISYYQQRRLEHQQNLSAGVIEKTLELAHVGLEVTAEKILAEKEKLSLGSIVSATEMALKMAGMGPEPRSNPNVVVNNVQSTQPQEVSGAVILAAQETMRRLNNENDKIFEGSLVETEEDKLRKEAIELDNFSRGSAQSGVSDRPSDSAAGGTEAPNLSALGDVGFPVPPISSSVKEEDDD